MSQPAALDSAKADTEARGKLQSRRRGGRGAHGTFPVSTSKGVGRIYQPAFISTSAEVGFTRLCDRKALISSCFGKTPLPTFLGAAPRAREKQLGET
jgi:hypothetical protein